MLNVGAPAPWQPATAQPSSLLRIAESSAMEKPAREHEGAAASGIVAEDEADVFAHARGTDTRKTAEVACGPVGCIGIETLPIHRIANVLGALVRVVAINACAKHSVLTHACSTYARKTFEIAGRSIGEVRIRTLAVRRIAGARGALVLVVTVDVRAQHAATNPAYTTGA